MDYRISVISHAGGRERNEDCYGYREVADIVCCVLADGAGGHHGGDVASRLCVDAVLEDFTRAPDVTSAAVRRMLDAANDAVLRRQVQDKAVDNMHSTLVILLFDPKRQLAIWGHVGDSRLYLFRNGALSLRTRDHSLVQTMIDSGLLQESDAQTHVQRNILVSSIGSVESFLPSAPDAPLQLKDGDAFLLCSDGVWGLLDDLAFERCLGQSVSSEDWLAHLEALITPQLKAGSDNYTALAVWCGEVTENMRTLPAPV